MLALQYSIHLPHDTNDQLIEERVKQRAPVFEAIPGMLHKSFLYNRADKLYAPFYVWEDLTGARDFLFDELFKGFVSEFRRPRTRSWTVLFRGEGQLVGSMPRFARCESDLVPAEKSLEQLIQEEQKKHEELLQNPDLYFHLTALNPDRWELMHYSLWRDESVVPLAEADCVQDFEVLHINEPQRSEPLVQRA